VHGGGVGSAQFSGFGPDAPLNLDGLTLQKQAEVLARLLSPDFEDWSAAAAKIGNCARPIRLRGSSTTVDRASGEVLSTYSTASEPLGVLYVRCGNRRASECPSCSRVYAADTFHLIRAGVVGGKTVPESIAENPLLFVTLTAPSFGPVHGLRDGKRCRPYRTKGEVSTCPHGRPTDCHAVHDENDPLVGQPLCWECYDYLGHLTWQWWAPELWRRFTITLKREVAKTLGVPDSSLAEVATVQYAKVAEYQRRGLIHFHALIRLDGRRTDAGFSPAPDQVDAADLGPLIDTTAAAVAFTAPALFDGDVPRVLRFGAQIDVRAVRSTERTDDPGDVLCAEQVAGYLAKYSTKCATDTAPDAATNAHLIRLRTILAETAQVVDDEARAAGILDLDDLKALPYGLLGKWTHMLGFRGHFSTKSRRYSVTLGQLRRARRRYHALVANAARLGEPVDVGDLDRLLLDEDDQETILVIGSWGFSGAGWDTQGDAELAKAAAARAREYAQHQAAVRRRINSEDNEIDRGVS
jgi:hypothetical protein